MEATQVRQHDEKELWFEVFVDYDVDAYAEQVEDLKRYHNVESGLRGNEARCQKAIDVLHENRIRRSRIWQHAVALDSNVWLLEADERDVFWFRFTDRKAAAWFKLTYC